MALDCNGRLFVLSCIMCTASENKLAECFICNSQSQLDTLFAIMQDAGSKLEEHVHLLALSCMSFCFLCFVLVQRSRENPFLIVFDLQ